MPSSLKSIPRPFKPFNSPMSMRRAEIERGYFSCRCVFESIGVPPMFKSARPPPHIIIRQVRRRDCVAKEAFSHYLVSLLILWAHIVSFPIYHSCNLQIGHITRLGVVVTSLALREVSCPHSNSKTTVSPCAL